MMRSFRRWPVALAIGLVIGMPATALLAAPGAVAKHPAPKHHGGGAPGSKLAGINSSSTASGMQLITYTPGVAPVGDVKKGDIAEGSFPYSISTTGTGPTTAGISAPAWPGAVAANGGNSLQTFDPSFPKPLVQLLNDPVAARSTYPKQLDVKTTGSFEPPGESTTGVGGAHSTSAKGNTFAKAEVNDTAPFGTGKTGKSLVAVGSATTLTTATVHAASVATDAQTHVSNISIAGVIDIAGVSSESTASSDGKHGRQHSSIKVGAVTVAGLSASIGPKGITIDKQDSLAKQALVPEANTLLNSLQKNGLTVTTVAPVHHVKKAKASGSSGAVQVSFEDKNLPNLSALLPEVPLPLPNSAGFDLNIGFSAAAAHATRLPPIPPIKKVKTPPVPKKVRNGGGGQAPTGSVSSGGGGPTGSVPGGGAVTSGGSGGGQAPVFAGQPAAAVIFGIPLRVAWVVFAFLLALFTAGPLLAYANWQLLRGRTP